MTPAKSILAIAFNTFKEAVRNRILYIILFFALIMIGSSGVISQLTISDREKIILDLGFAAINLFGVAIAVFVGVSLVYNELERRTIYTIVSKPIARWQFLLGKYFGLMLTIFVNVFIMAFFFLLMLHYESGRQEIDATFGSVVFGSIVKSVINLFNWNAYEATRHVMVVICATLIELVILTAFAILYSSFSTPTLSMFFTVLTFIAGRLNKDIVEFAKTIKRNASQNGGPIPESYYIAKAAALVTPNLEVFHNTVDQALYEDKVVLLWRSVIYALFYSAAILMLSVLIFNRRNFK